MRAMVRPFLKWAGGKSQLLREIERYYPFADGKITKYAEPFVGGGAVLFDILNRYSLNGIFISDVNEELINSYRVIGKYPAELISMLGNMRSEFMQLNMEKRKKYYNHKRDRFNELIVMGGKDINVEKAALLIFLNKTCFNGLYRVNKKGLFNVPMGKYRKPVIFDEANIWEIAKKIQNIEIACANYACSESFIDKHTFVYFDPPYRPLSPTASFTSYNQNTFGDDEQRELARFVNAMHKKGARIVVSNSDPKNINSEDDFFDNIYSEYKVRRVEASRMINSRANARGQIRELLISNY